jgi:hypothetical protein
MERVWVAAILLLGCASSRSSSAVDAAVGGVDAAESAIDGGPGDETCESGQVATGVGENGVLACATVDDATATAVRSSCAVYLGQSDNCDGCNAAPAKWSAIKPSSCSVGVGVGNACISSFLDDLQTPTALATLDLDGDVNDDDKLYTSLHCSTGTSTLSPAPCEAGWAIVGRSGGDWMCAPIGEAAVGYVRSRCAVYLGWQDGCDGCVSVPTKWGFANDAGCTNGVGADDTCTTATLSGETVNLFGLNTDGDVDGNDKLHLGLHCDAIVPAGGTSTTLCPEGQFVTGTNGDGSFDCADPTAAFAAYVGDHCSLFYGWHDACGGCTQAPTKWGKLGTSACTNGLGADGTCTDMTLGLASVPMFGLSPDGNVNDDDTLYVGFRCDLSAGQ